MEYAFTYLIYIYAFTYLIYIYIYIYIYMRYVKQIYFLYMFYSISTILDKIIVDFLTF